MIEIHQGSPAFAELRRVMAEPDTHKVSIDIRANSRVAIKRNEGVWSASLSTDGKW